MSKPVIGLVVATLMCGTASAYLWKELRTARTEAQTLQTRIAELERVQVAPPLTHSESPRNELPEPEPASEPGAAIKPPATQASPPQAAVFAAAPTIATNALARPPGRTDPEMRRRMQENFERQQAMLKDPEYRELMRAQQKMGMRRMYADMEMMMGLSKEEADRVRDVLAEQQLRSMEQRPFMAPFDGSPPDQAAIREQQRVFEELKRKNDAELQAALGPKYSDWQAYQNSMWSRSQVMHLREALVGSAEPLREDQLKPLVQALSREQQQLQTNTVRAQHPAGLAGPEAQLRMQEEWLERTAQSHERIRNAVSSLLTPTQMQQLQEQQDQERKMHELNLRMQRAQVAEAQARGEDPSNTTQSGAAISANGTVILGR
jgi:hypothetical protein